MTQWQPIETAPKEQVILFFPAEQKAGRNSRLHWMVSVGRVSDYPFRKPTHWMPLPAPPGATPAGIQIGAVPNWDAIAKRLMQLLTSNTVQVFAKDGGVAEPQAQSESKMAAEMVDLISAAESRSMATSRS